MRFIIFAGLAFVCLEASEVWDLVDWLIGRLLVEESVLAVLELVDVVAHAVQLSVEAGLFLVELVDGRDHLFIQLMKHTQPRKSSMPLRYVSPHKGEPTFVESGLFISTRVKQLFDPRHKRNLERLAKKCLEKEECWDKQWQDFSVDQKAQVFEGLTEKDFKVNKL